jgi:hypothetical protein
VTVGNLRFAGLAIGLSALCFGGCAMGPTTVFLQVNGDSGVAIDALYGQVTLGSGPAGTEQRLAGSVHLPGTLTVLLPDSSEMATIQLRAVTSQGTMLFATVDVVPVPHQQIERSVTLTADVEPPPPQAAPDMALPPAADLALVASPDMAPVVLARDNFHRPNQALWGTASDGQVWGADANTNGAFSIVNDTGQVTDSVVENVSAALGPSVANSDVVVTFSVSSFVTTTSNNEFGAMFRWTDNNNFYKAGMNGTNFRLYVRTTAGPVTLSTIPFAASAGVAYTIRVRAVGSSLMAKAWPAASPEPAAWTVTATDGSLATGRCGMRLVFNATATVTVTSFLATAP